MIQQIVALVSGMVVSIINALASNLMALLFKVDDARGGAWKALFRQHAPDIEVRFWPEVGDPAQVRYLAAWQPPGELHARFPNLEVIFATSAGVDQFDLGELPAHIKVVRMLDPGIAQGIIEYACFAVLGLHRQVPLYLRQQQAAQWREHPLTPARQRRVGVMGLGNLGVAVLNALKPFDFKLYGWARSPRRLEAVECYAGDDQLGPFLTQVDILLCLLPLTDSTRGILNARTFAALPRGASLINLGRGGHLIEADLLQALSSGHISHAVVDVLEQEPPGQGHPFWHHPKIWVTPHIGAMTSPDTAFEVLLANIRRHEKGVAMEGLVARNRGY